MLNYRLHAYFKCALCVLGAHEIACDQSRSIEFKLIETQIIHNFHCLINAQPQILHLRKKNLYFEILIFQLAIHLMCVFVFSRIHVYTFTGHGHCVQIKPLSEHQLTKTFLTKYINELQTDSLSFSQQKYNYLRLFVLFRVYVGKWKKILTYGKWTLRTKNKNI